MENSDFINTIVENAKCAFQFLKENNLSEPLIQSSKMFVDWFKGLFKRESHINRVQLMEDGTITEQDTSILSNELILLMEENQLLVDEFRQKLEEFELAKRDEPNQSSIQIINSKNTVVSMKNIHVEGNFQLGDNLK